ncbi:hypothetical protein GCM10018980_40320 [Streptomyces capoamus]|uniref:Uncharacterized protein n=1 Tax=Streptomyces capoamus TaxID=68183 RepID=A0A919C7C4_9ACTN|nr:hypothetical protein GCM10010501_25870 [Streptomyces libani subsp. rufus]GHG55100.1 hypothetical protein GCM10018980_40320 [Streptomyces capoamus]
MTPISAFAMTSTLAGARRARGAGAGVRLGGTPKTLPSRDGRAGVRGSQAAELLVELDDEEDEVEDEDVEEDVFESDDEPAGLDAGELLDVEPRESLR